MCKDLERLGVLNRMIMAMKATISVGKKTIVIHFLIRKQNLVFLIEEKE